MRLFKYLSYQRSDVLTNGLIRFTQPQALNDPFELKPHIHSLAKEEELLDGMDEVFARIVAEEYEQYRRAISFPEFLANKILNRPAQNLAFPIIVAEQMPEINKMLHRVFNKTIGVLCLTTTPDNLLMWSHYADGHQGFIIEFDSDSHFFDQRDGENDYRYLQKVQYCEKRPAFILKEVKNTELLLTKSTDWSYEAEWRMFLPLANATTQNSKIKPEVYLFNFPKASIRSVIFGCRASDVTKNKISKIIRKNREYAHVQLMQAMIDSKSYAINFQTLA